MIGEYRILESAYFPLSDIHIQRSNSSTSLLTDEMSDTTTTDSNSSTGSVSRNSNADNFLGGDAPRTSVEPANKRRGVDAGNGVPNAVAVSPTNTAVDTWEQFKKEVANQTCIGTGAILKGLCFGGSETVWMLYQLS